MWPWSRGSRQRTNTISFLFNPPILFIEALIYLNLLNSTSINKIGGLNKNEMGLVLLLSLDDYFSPPLQTHSSFFPTWASFHLLSISLSLYL